MYWNSPKLHTKLHLRPETKPVFRKPHKLPYVIQKQVELELLKLATDGIIKIDNWNWASPLVIVRKPYGSLRLCIQDYSQSTTLWLSLSNTAHRWNTAQTFWSFSHLTFSKSTCTFQWMKKARLSRLFQLILGLFELIRLLKVSKLLQIFFITLWIKFLETLHVSLSTSMIDIVVYGVTLQKCYSKSPHRLPLSFAGK